MLTINEALALQTAVKRRVSELQTLRNQVSMKKSSLYRFMDKDKEDIEEPQYDVKFVDKKITELETFLFKVDSGIKQSNALTKIDIAAKVEDLLAPLE